MIIKRLLITVLLIFIIVGCGSENTSNSQLNQIDREKIEAIKELISMYESEVTNKRFVRSEEEFQMRINKIEDLQISLLELGIEYISPYTTMTYKDITDIFEDETKEDQKKWALIWIQSYEMNFKESCVMESEASFDYTLELIKKYQDEYNELGGNYNSEYLNWTYDYYKNYYTAGKIKCGSNNIVSIANAPGQCGYDNSKSEDIKILDCDVDKFDKLHEIEIKLENNTGKDIEYIAVDIFFIDSSGKVVNSTYTNFRGTFKDGAEQILATYLSDDFSSKYTYEIEVSTINYK